MRCSVKPACSLLLAAILCGSSAGCGRSDVPKLVQVHGKATHGGKPLSNLTLHFEPETGRSCTAVTDALGEFEIAYDSRHHGAPAGKYRVWVAYVPHSPEEEIKLQMGQEQLPDPYPAVLEKYGDRNSTPMEIEIGRGGASRDLAFD